MTNNIQKLYDDAENISAKLSDINDLIKTIKTSFHYTVENCIEAHFLTTTVDDLEKKTDELLELQDYYLQEILKIKYNIK